MGSFGLEGVGAPAASEGVKGFALTDDRRVERGVC